MTDCFQIGLFDGRVAIIRLYLFPQEREMGSNLKATIFGFSLQNNYSL